MVGRRWGRSAAHCARIVEAIAIKPWLIGAGTACRQASAGARVSKRGCEKRTPAEKREYVRHCRSPGLSIAEGCQLMGISRSSFYEAPIAAPDDTAIVEAIAAICDEFEFYGCDACAPSCGIVA
jgi:hypothetical protein